MDKDCAIARDLMPQVIDNVASEESRAFVESHAAACESCAQAYADMKNEIAGADAPKNADEAVSFKAAVSQLKKTLAWKRLRTALIAALLTLVVVVAGGFAYTYLFSSTVFRTMPMDAYAIKLYQCSDGTVYGETRFLKNFNGSGPKVTIAGDGDILYIHWTSAILPIEGNRVCQGNPNYGIRLTAGPDDTLLRNGGTPVREIRQGTEDDYAVVYRAGDAIPPLAPAVDAYLCEQERFFNRMDEAYEMMSEAQDVSFEAQSAFQVFIDQWENEQKAQPAEVPAP